MSNNVEETLISSIKLSLLGQRHLIISSPDPVLTERELLKISEKLFINKCFTNLILNNKSSITVLTDLIDINKGKLKNDQHTESGRLMLILRGLERTSSRFQVELLDIIKTIENTNKIRSDNFFLLISISENIEGNELSLYKYLQNQFWFRQPHLIEKNKSRIFNNNNNSGVSTLSSDSILFENDSINFEDNIEDILMKRSLIPQVQMIPEINRYILDIIVFTRNHRMVRDGIPTRFIWDFQLLIKCLAVMNNYEFVIPIMVKLAARKFFPLKINLCDNPEDEPSLNWGSDINLIKKVTLKWNVDLVIEDVLNSVRAPV